MRVRRVGRKVTLPLHTSRIMRERCVACPECERAMMRRFECEEVKDKEVVPLMEKLMGKNGSLMGWLFWS